MLGIRLTDEAEERLARYARDVGRPKSVIARDWITERLDRETVDDLIRNAARLHADDRDAVIRQAAMDATDAHLRWLDGEDGGYDWGPEGPPALK